MFLYCATLYRWQWPSLSARDRTLYTPQVDVPSNIKRWTHGLSKPEWCIKPNQILMSWSLLCMCCKEQLPLFIVQENKVELWSYISVDLGHIVCDGLLGLYVLIYAIYISHKHICWTWETSLGKWSILPCHGLGENVTPGADALKAIIYVICRMQHNASAVHQNITELPHVTITPFYTSGECTTKVSSGTYAGKCDWSPGGGGGE